ncbi:MAG: alanine--glyoxylate aminotransferase family protein, partial [Actinobacteria bacterium]
MPLSERILMGPGPSNPYPEVTAALARPLLGHLDPEFLSVLDEVCDRLRAVFRTGNALTLPISGTGSAGMEAAFVNLVEPGDPVVIGVNGLFGERMCDVAGRCGAEVTRVDAAW